MDFILPDVRIKILYLLDNPMKYIFLKVNNYYHAVHRHL